MRRSTRGKSNSPTRYAIYMRCSSDDQAYGDFTTIDSQRDKNVKYVVDRGGLLVGEYSDEGRTGTNLKRAGYKALIRDAEQGKFDVVVTTYMSRLARGKIFYLAEHDLKEAGVRDVQVEEDFADDMAGHMTKELTIFLDGMYPKQISLWTKTKQAAMVKRGYYCGGRPPLGYVTVDAESSDGFGSEERKPKRLVVNPDEESIVKRAFTLFLEKRTIAAVRDYMRTVTDLKWDTSKAKYLLQNQVYIGHYTYGANRLENAHQPIVSVETWNAVQEVLEKPSDQSREPVGTKHTFFLRGRVACPHCSGQYTQASAKGDQYAYYVCLKDQKGYCKCPVRRISADSLHHSVLREIRRAAEHHTVMHKLIAESGGWQGVDDGKRSLRGQLAKRKQFLDVQISNLTRAIGEGRALNSLLASLEQREQEYLELQQSLAVIDAEIARATVKRPTAEQVQAVWLEFLRLWDHATDEEREMLIGHFVKRVEVKDKKTASMWVEIHIEAVLFSEFAINSDLGAGTGLEPVTFGL